MVLCPAVYCHGDAAPGWVLACRTSVSSAPWFGPAANWNCQVAGVRGSRLVGVVLAPAGTAGPSTPAPSRLLRAALSAADRLWAPAPGTPAAATRTRLRKRLEQRSEWLAIRILPVIRWLRISSSGWR